MAKKSKRHGGSKLPPKTSQDPKGLNTNAFAVLPGLFGEASQEEIEAYSLKTVVALARVDANIKAQQAQEKAQSSRLHEPDVDDMSGMSDLDIFLQSVSDIDRTDVLNRKFSEKSAPIAQDKAEHQDRLSMTAEEREFALFTQEMALSNVKPIEAPTLMKGARDRKKSSRVSEQMANSPLTDSNDDLWEQSIADEEEVLIQDSAKAAEQRSDANAQAPQAREAVKATPVQEPLAEPQTDVKTASAEQRVRTLPPRAPVYGIRASRQLVPDYKKQDMGPKWEPLRPDQKAFILEIKAYEQRFGKLISLKLRGFVLEAGMSRFEDFIEACFENKTRYGSLFFGDALSAKGVENQLREKILMRLKSDERILKFAPAMDAENTFTTIYLAFVRY